MGFQLAPRSMTLDDLELLRDFLTLGGNHGETIEDRPVMSATEL